MYEEGKGVEKDYGKAYELYLQSAERGNSMAFNNLVRFFQLELFLALILNQKKRESFFKMERQC